MSKLASKVVEQARAWLGKNESNGTHKEIIDVYNSHRPLPRGYAVKYTDAWCSTFVSAVAVKLGYTDIIPTECGCEKHIQLFKKIGCWIENENRIPKAGEIIFYDWNDTGSGDNVGNSDHVGIVEKVEGSTITVIEGNINNSVGRRKIAVNGKYIRGYGIPKYDVEIVEKKVEKSDITVIAKEVIAGKWGNGQARSDALSKAGYNASEVQAKVNELLGTSKADITAIAKEVIAGKWGNGKARSDALSKAGYNASEVQAKVNELLGTSKADITAIAKEVIAGKWGNGKARSDALSKAGYNASEVQAKVNELLK